MTATGPDLHGDVVVVGLGLVGAAALRHLALDGAKVVGIGPGEPEAWATHTGVFASHYDSGRITRKLDARSAWAELAVRSIAAYPQIAATGGVEFHQPVGTIFASRDLEFVAALDRVGREVGAEHRLLGVPAGGRVADGLLAPPPGAAVVAEPAPAGWIDPRRMLDAQLRAADAAGAIVRREQVVAIEPVGASAGWRVTAADGSMVEAPLVLLATGAHTDELAPPGFAGTVRPETVVLATLDADEQARLASLPSVLAHLDGSSFADLYQVPPAPYPDGTVRLKLGATLRSWEPLTTGAQRRAWMAGADHEHHLAELRGLVEDLVPGVRATAWTTKPCLITDTPSGLPTVDHLAPGLVVAAGGNGYAAKSADAIGALAAGLVTRGRWTDAALAAAEFALPAR